MSVAYATIVVCPVCGRRREVSRRHSRRNATCRDCAHQIKHGPPTDRERRWWLKNFSDEEILDFAESLWGEKGDIKAIASWRVILSDDV